MAAAGNDGRNNSAGNNGYGTINSPGNDPLRDYGRSDEEHGFAAAGGRSDRELQFQRPDASRSHHQARSSRTGQPGLFASLAERIAAKVRSRKTPFR